MQFLDRNPGLCSVFEGDLKDAVAEVRGDDVSVLARVPALTYRCREDHVIGLSGFSRFHATTISSALSRTMSHAAAGIRHYRPMESTSSSSFPGLWRRSRPARHL